MRVNARPQLDPTAAPPDIGVLQRRARTATVTALTDMRLLVINGRDLDWLFEDERLAARVRANLERHLAGPQPSPDSG
ncbi:MAG TPA: hypothetical protein VFI40_07380 [Nocardioides sp.]|nr:hypothetical protein [Nocardioides sp.]